MHLMSDQVFSNLIHDVQKDITKRMQRENIPGLAISILDKDVVLWEAGFGVTDHARKIPVTPHTIFSLQSCSKTFTTTAILFAIQEGLINLDTSIKKYLPGYKIQSRFEQHPEEKITLRHLLAHKAGFSHEAPIGNNFVYDTAGSTFEAHIESIQRTWLRFPVGQRFFYSNLGIDLAGYILQQVTGMPFAEYMKIKLFEPLGMSRSSFDFNEIAADDDRALGHDGFYATLRKSVPLVVPMLPSGGIYSDVTDAARFIQFHMNRGRIGDTGLLDNKYLNEMYKLPWPVDDQREGYRLGISISNHQGLQCYNHSGGGFGFLSDIIWYSDVGLGIVILTNSTSHHLQWWYAIQILDKILDLPEYKDRKSQLPAKGAPEQPIRVLPKSSSIPKHLIGHYVGKIPGSCHINLAQGELVIRYNWEKKSKQLVFYSDKEAYVFGTGTDIESNPYQRYRFFTQEDGRPAYFVNLRDGSTYSFNEGAYDKPGVEKENWRQYAGDYSIRGCYLPNLMTVYRHNGHLYLKTANTKLRMEEFAPGLFFTATGEAIDFRGEYPLIAGMVYEKINFSTKLRHGIVLTTTLIRIRISAIKASLMSRLK